MKLVDYPLLGEALKYYTSGGYSAIEVPWTVPQDILGITFGNPVEGNRYLDRYLVYSAEQSFLDIIINGNLPYGKYCAITPCFRNDDIDELHQKYFMKLELFHYLTPLQNSENWLNIMTAYVAHFFNMHTTNMLVEVVKTKDPLSLVSYDIEVNGIEVGSYGLRRYKDITWVYGTGLAEPRFSNLVRA